MTDIESADGSKLELPMLTLTIDGETARSAIADLNQGPRAGAFSEMVQAALLNAPDNPWLVNHVRVGFRDWEVAAPERTGRSSWFPVEIREQPGPDDEVVHGLAFEVLADQTGGDRPSFRVRRVREVTRIAGAR